MPTVKAQARRPNRPEAAAPRPAPHDFLGEIAECGVTDCVEIRSKDFINAILETVAALVIVLDREGRVIRFNRACERASGWSTEAVRGRSVWDLLIPADEVAELRRLFEALLEGQEAVHIEARLRQRDGGQRLICWNGTPLADARGRVEYVIGTGIDITEQRRAEEQVRRHLEELSHAHRLQTAGELATMLAHEINQPLTAIASYGAAGLQQLEQAAPDPAQLRRSLEQIERQALRAGDTIRHLRNFVNRGRIDPQPADLNAIVRSVKELIAPRARSRGIAIELDLAEPLAPVMAVEVQIEQVLLNLIRNGIDAIRDAGMKAGSIAIRTRQAGDMARVSVEDSGLGLSAEGAARLFEPFYTSKPYGLGVGLRICRSLVEAHHGRLWAEAHNPGGRFHFTLPFAP